MRFGIIGSGSWATALAKILTDNKHPIHWLIRSEETIRHLKHRHHNPHYLSSVVFDTSLLHLTDNINDVIQASDCIVIAVPSSYVIDTLSPLEKDSLSGKIIVSAIKGILPQINLLLNDFLQDRFNLTLNNYHTIMGPCHAEEVAAEKLSYLTFSGKNIPQTQSIAACFATEYLNTVINNDVIGVQYAATMFISSCAVLTE